MRTMPTCSPFGPTSRTSGTRMRSLMRGSVLLRGSGVMGPPQFEVVTGAANCLHTETHTRHQAPVPKAHGASFRPIAHRAGAR
jgi:hypothetical protein